MTAPLAVELGRWAAAVGYQDIPPAVVDSAKDRVMDTLGICVAALGTDAAGAARGLRDEMGRGRPQASFVGEAERGSAAMVALVNGTYAHSLDFDDTHLPSVVHPSAPMVPALLAAAEACGASGKDVLTALVAAYEINTRLSMAQFDSELGNSVFFEQGLHATSILGAVAGAAGCARLRGLDTDGVTNAIAIACSMGSGVIEANRAGGSIKKFHGGWAAQAAVVAAGMAAHGLTGPPTVLEGRFGFFQAYCGDRWHAEQVLAELGRRWDTPSIVYKPYPCNHFTHAIVDAALRLRARGIDARDVSSVEIGTAAAPWRTIGDPIEEKRHPRTPYHAAFSAPFVFATAMVGGGGLGVGFDDFSEAALGDPERRRLASVCSVVVDDQCTRVFPHQFPAVVRVQLVDGSETEERVVANRAVGREDLEVKLAMNAGALAERIAAACAALDAADSMSDLMDATR